MFAPLAAQRQGDKAGDHAGRDEEFLKQAHLGPQELSDEDKQGRDGKVQ